MAVNQGGFAPTPYRHERRIAFSFDALGLTAGTTNYKIIDIPKGARLTDVTLMVETAAVNGSGSTQARIITDETVTEIVLGSTPINLEATGFYSFATAAGSGGPATATGCRKKTTASRALNLEVSNLTAAASSSAAGVLTVGIIDEDQGA